MNISPKTKWLLQSTLGLILTGAGLSLAIDAGFRKYAGDPWVLYGTLALIIFNSGLCLAIDSGLGYLKHQSKGQ